MLALLPLILSLAPELARLLTGQTGQQITTALVGAVRSVTGTTDPTTATAAVAADPDLAAKLTLELHKAANDAMAVQLAGVDSARRQTVDLAQARSWIAYGAPITSIITLLSFGGSVWFLMLHSVPESNARLLDLIVGALATMAANVNGYWIGSSSGSASKNASQTAANAETLDMLRETHRAIISRTPYPALPAPAALPLPSVPPAPELEPDPEPEPEPDPQPQAPAPPNAVTEIPDFLRRAAPAKAVVAKPAPDRTAFFDAVRGPVFGGHMKQSQVDGCINLLDYWDTKFPEGDVRWLSYCLATTAWETGFTMEPVEEAGHGAGKPYAEGGWWARGYVGLTWEANYRRAGNAIGVDLIAHKELALEVGVALPVLFLGMMGGWFTGRKLSDYFDLHTDNPLGARAIVNGTDRAQEIKQLHEAFLYALKSS